MNRRNFTKTLIGGVIGAPLVLMAFGTNKTNTETIIDIEMTDGWKRMKDQSDDMSDWCKQTNNCVGTLSNDKHKVYVNPDPHNYWWSFAGYNRGQIKNVVMLGDVI